MNTILSSQNPEVTLYQLDSKGKVRVWKIEVVPTLSINKVGIVMTKGLETGKHTVDTQYITEGLNIGKQNETTCFAQAIADAQSKVNKKVKDGYVADRNNLKANDELGSGTKAPMTAQKYHPEMKQSSSKNLDKMGIRGKKGYIQRKKDGNRLNIKVNKQGVSLTFRSGDSVPLNGLEHITDSILSTFQKSAEYYKEKYGIEEYVLDGELYTPEYSFNKANGVCKKEVKTAEDLIVAKSIKYHLYDVMLPVGYETRYKVIQNFESESVHVEEAIEIVFTDEIIAEYLEKFLKEGEEGAMLRLIGVPYEHKRSWSLVKVKIFEDAEFEILGFDESVRKGMAGAVWVKLPVPSKDREGNEITKFKAGMNFSHEEAKEMWENKDSYVGKMGTVCFFGLSEYGVPRFPKFKAVRDKNN